MTLLNPKPSTSQEIGHGPVSEGLKTGKGQIEFDLDEQEYCAIGRVTAQWAYLEHGVYAVTANIAKANGRGAPGDARSTSFQRRLSALRLLIEECVAGAERENVLKLISRIANAEQDRHKITQQCGIGIVPTPIVSAPQAFALV